MATCCTRKHGAHTKTSARDALKRVTPSDFAQVRDGYVDSGIGMEFYHLTASREGRAQYKKYFERNHFT